jgi:hypothetical protein
MIAAPDLHSARELLSTVTTVEELAALTPVDRENLLISLQQDETLNRLMVGWVLQVERAEAGPKATDKAEALRRVAGAVKMSIPVARQCLRVAERITPALYGEFQDLTWGVFAIAVERTHRDGEDEESRSRRIHRWLDRAQEEQFSPDALKHAIRTETPGLSQRVPPMEPCLLPADQALLERFQDGLALFLMVTFDLSQPAASLHCETLRQRLAGCLDGFRVEVQSA